MAGVTYNQAPASEDSAHGLRRELGVLSLVLTQIMYVVGAAWVGVAATVGSAHAVLWIAAAAFFFLPLAMLVAELAKQMPLEGGLYRWSEAAFGPLLGYFVAWNLWSYTVVVLATIGVGFAANVGYVFPGFSVDNPWHMRAASFAAVGLGAIVAGLGLRIGKWVHGFGGAVHVGSFMALVLVPFVALGTGRLQHYHPLDIAIPAATLFTLNIFSKLAMGAFSGFEYIAILAGECRNPSRTIVRSVWIATPVIILMFVLGTCSTVALVPQDRLDLIAPISQTVRAALGDTALSGLLARTVVVCVALRIAANICFTFAGSVRLPMVAAWQGQAPGWLGSVSRRFGSPLHSAFLVTAIVMALIVASQFGTRAQETFQLLDNASTVLYGITYLALFAIPLVGHRSVRDRIAPHVRLAAVPGFVVTLLSIVLALVPIVNVASGLAFAAKIIVVTALFNVVGLVLYVVGRQAVAGPASGRPDFE